MMRRLTLKDIRDLGDLLADGPFVAGESMESDDGFLILSGDTAFISEGLILMREAL